MPVSHPPLAEMKVRYAWVVRMNRLHPTVFVRPKPKRKKEETK